MSDYIDTASALAERIAKDPTFALRDDRAFSQEYIRAVSDRLFYDWELDDPFEVARWAWDLGPRLTELMTEQTIAYQLTYFFDAEWPECIDGGA